MPLKLALMHKVTASQVAWKAAREAVALKVSIVGGLKMFWD